MKPAVLIATSGGAGFIPFAPGTFGALVGFLISIGLLSLQLRFFEWNLLHALLIISSYIAGVWATVQLEKEWGHDPSRIVIDETIGFWVSILFIPMEIQYLLVAFVLFRIFDIFKPLGIRKIDKLKSSHSVMLDDVAAGILTNICIQIYLYWYG
ncbi:MAG: phosphatidylglycerophosphatase A [Saprospiraceae bacterium]|nr:phosphatidylglycerophosphatase A [Saprospiraceae bacterium]